MSFEDELGEALRRTGDGFTADRHALAEAGERRGRRLVARRRAAVAGGSVLAIALIGTAGAYTGGLIGPSGSAQVAAPPTPKSTAPHRDGPPGAGGVSADDMLADLEALLPGGKLSGGEARGTDSELYPMASGIYDDGKGRAAVSVSLSQVDPLGSHAHELTSCGDRKVVGYDDCTVENLPDGTRILLEKGYEYSDRRVDTKAWRAVLVNPRGFMVTATEWNAASEKGSPVTRTDPPLSTVQLKALVTSTVWHKALNAVPAAPAEAAAQRARSTGVSGKDALVELLEKYGIPLASAKGRDQFGQAVLHDGKGLSLVQLSHTKGDNRPALTGPGVTTTDDGTRMQVIRKAAEHGRGVVEWTVEAVRPNGLRVVVTAYNTGEQFGAATRPEPALSVAQLTEIALAPRWSAIP
ncbi:hypothetical protein ACFWUQ_12745 [Streptomyces sp. NPDC058662]|uniref:hypothetical protein n=1 Tax=Streptomyces sp. NPDC058662 TaxID=3346583 RepID=UPI0036494F8A